MIENLKNFICRPVPIIVMLALAVASVVVFAVSNNMYQEDAKIISNLQLDSVERDSETGKLVGKLVNPEEKQKEDYQSITSKLTDAANPEKAVTDKIDSYINSRYNFDNGASSVKEKLLNELKSYATADFIKYAESSINNEKMNSSKATIVKRFISGRSMEMLNSSVDTLSYTYVIDINGKQFLIQYTCKLSSGDWMLSSEKVLKSLQDGEKFD